MYRDLDELAQLAQFEDDFTILGLGRRVRSRGWTVRKPDLRV
jgi:hypothetical protein